MGGTEMSDPQVVSRDEWLVARKKLLVHEKELTHHRDEVNAERRRLPMVEIEKEYVFAGPAGQVSLRDLFEGRRQLLIYHFMFDPSWEEGCPSCSFVIDNLGHLSHLHARNTSWAAISRAPIEALEAYKRRMGWTIPWYSSYGTDFNHDFHVTLDPAVTPVEYNSPDQPTPADPPPPGHECTGPAGGLGPAARSQRRGRPELAPPVRPVRALAGGYRRIWRTPTGQRTRQ